MKTLSVLSYVIGGILLIISCFTTGISATWWLGGIAIVCLIIGCIFQFQYKKHEVDEMIDSSKHNF